VSKSWCIILTPLVIFRTVEKFLLFIFEVLFYVAPFKATF
jgi:hypothetical protein